MRKYKYTLKPEDREAINDIIEIARNVAGEYRVTPKEHRIILQEVLRALLDRETIVLKREKV